MEYTNDDVEALAREIRGGRHEAAGTASREWEQVPQEIRNCYCNSAIKALEWFKGRESIS